MARSNDVRRNAGTLSHIRGGLALMLCASAAAQAAEFGTPAWINQKVQAPTVAPSPSPSSPEATDTPYAGIGVVTTPDQAWARTQMSMRNLAEAARRIAEAQAAQQQAAAAQGSGAGSFVPNGLGPGGLEVVPGAVPESSEACITGGQCLWVAAELPTQTIENDRTLVTVEQTDQNAILTWQTFNIGSQTTLRIDQGAGTDANGDNDWIALNRIANSTAPSLIYGRLEAEGTVYLVNSNGILFGAGSQTNTHSLLASTLALFGSDPLASVQAFLSKGLHGIPNGTPALDYPFLGQFPRNRADASAILGPPPPVPGNIQVEAGATIQAGELGYAFLSGTHVSNAGAIVADDGQVLLAAALGLAVSRRGAAGVDATQLELSSLYWLEYQRPLDDLESNAERRDVTPLMTVSNTGLIRAERGNVTLLGSQVLQDGVVQVSSSLTRPGSISLIGSDGTPELAVGHISPFCIGPSAVPCVPPNPLDVGLLARNHVRTVVLGEGSTTALLPSLNGETTISTDAATEAFNAGSVNLQADAITLESGALVEAPGASFSAATFPPATTVDTSAVTGRIYIDRGAIVDVSGLADVRLALDSLLITIPRIGLNELADSPVQRDGALFRQTDFVIDSTISGIRDDGTPWVGSPLLNVQGYVDGVERNIEHLLIDAGSITLTGAQIITAAGSSLRLDGGYLHYESGEMGSETRLLGADGRYYSLSRADPMATYLGVAGEHSVEHSRWNLTSIYADPLISGARSARGDGYIVGGDGGALAINHAFKTVMDDSSGQTVLLHVDNAILLGGDISARALSGRRQIETADLPEGGSFIVQGGCDLVCRGQLLYAGLSAPRGDEAPFMVALADDAVDLDTVVAGFDSATPIPAGSPYVARLPLSGPALSAAGFSDVAIRAGAITVAGTQGLAVQPGGSIVLESTGAGPAAVTDPRLNIHANLTAPGGSIQVSSSFVTHYFADLTYPGTNPTGLAGPQPSGTILIVPYDELSADINVTATLSVRGRWVNDAGLPPDSRAGHAFIDGGSISLSTNAAACCTTRPNTTNLNVLFPGGDLSGSIVLHPGSMLDASGGGYVQPDGALAAVGGVPLGRGGDISLTTYAPSAGLVPILVQPGSRGPRSDPLLPGRIEFGGVLLGYGFGGGDGTATGGTLLLRTLDIQIGGSHAVEEEALHLTPAFFSTQGFAAYDLSAAWDAAIADGVDVTVTHLNMIPSDAVAAAPTGADLYDYRYTRIGQLDDYRRGPTDFALHAGDGVGMIGPVPPRASYVDGSVYIGEGARLVTDPGSSILLEGERQVTVLGSIVAHGGSITLAQTGTPAALTAVGILPTASVWLGSDALLDVSGVVLMDPVTRTVPVAGGGHVETSTGSVLDGGTVLLSAASFIVAEPSAPGAGIDVEGAVGTLDLLPPDAAPILDTQIASDGGTITLATLGGLYFDATVRAAGGGETGRGGTLEILAAGDLILQQSGTFTPPGLQPGDLLDESYTALRAPSSNPAQRLCPTLGVVSIGPCLHTPGLGSTTLSLGALRIPLAVAGLLNTGHLVTTPNARIFAVDRLANSGVENLTVATPVLAFSGDVAIATPESPLRSFVAVASGLHALPAGTRDRSRPAAGETAGTVTIEAAYASLVGVPPPPPPGPGEYASWHATWVGNWINLNSLPPAPATLSVNASRGLDLVGQVTLGNFGTAGFVSEGDLRFLVPTALGDATGTVYANGDLAFSAARIYPASGTAFAIATPASVTFENCPGCASAGTVAPLSAGSFLIVDAAEIAQNGALYAPLGTVVLGVLDPADSATTAIFPRRAFAEADFPLLDGSVSFALVPTETVTFGAGSLTSVSADAEIVPYGHTVDGQEWEFVAETPLRAPPSAQLVVRSSEIALDAAAVLDLSGGRIDDGLAYERVGTTVTVTQAGHGLVAGDLVYVRDASEINEAFVRVASADADSWSFEAPATVVDLGATDKDEGLAYSYSGSAVTVTQGNHELRVGDLVTVENAADDELNGLRQVTAVTAEAWTFDIAAENDGSGELARVLTGDLQALEWIPGLGGTRNVLSQYAADGTPLFPDARAIYAIIPHRPDLATGFAPYDPDFDPQGQGAMLGQSVYLSGVGELPAGYYTLLPAEYATLPGAYRLVQDTSALDSAASQNRVLPDGSYRAAGYFTDGFSLDPGRDPARHDRRWTSFTVQALPVWAQYSDYALTSANAYFSNLAARSDTVTPLLPRDGGRLSLGASQSLLLGASLVSTPGQLGAPASVDVASNLIQVLPRDSEVLPGYLPIAVEDLSALNAGSLLVGGYRERTETGDVLTVLAQSVLLSNDSDSPLLGPEILLIGDRVELEDGASIAAAGPLPEASSVDLLIGAPGATGSGDGALLRVSNAARVNVTRIETGSASGVMLLAANSLVNGGASLTLNSAGAVQAPPTAEFWGEDIAITAGRIRFTADDRATGEGMLLIGPVTTDRLRDAENLALYGTGEIAFDRGVGVTLGSVLTLSSGRIAAGDGDDGDVTLTADHITLANLLGGPASTGAGPAGGTLVIQASVLAFGDGDPAQEGGDVAIDGFAAVDATATERMIGQGDGVFDAGTADVLLTTPLFVATRATDTTLSTDGELRLATTGADAPSFDEIGGTLRLRGGSVVTESMTVDQGLASQRTVGPVVAAPAGLLDIAAVGELTLLDGTRLDASGLALTYFDVLAFAPAGVILLSSAGGDVTVASGAGLDFSGASGADAGGDAGGLLLSAADGRVTLLGTTLGHAGAPDRLGGSIGVDTGGDLDLGLFAAAIRSSGISESVSVHTRMGNLVLPAGQVLQARTVSLIADGHATDLGGNGRPVPSDDHGNVIVHGDIDASGPDGGRIELVGFSGVEVQGTLLANATDAAAGRGGDVIIATGGSGDGGYHGTYGYQRVTADRSGTITVGDHALIDVGSAGTDPLLGGTIGLRLPLLDGGTVNFNSAAGAEFHGARDFGLEAYAVWSTTDSRVGRDGLYFDGRIDPYVAPITAPASQQNLDNNAAFLGKIDNSDWTCASTPWANCGYFNDRDRPQGTATPSGTLLLFVRAFALDGIPEIEGLRLRPGIELRADGDGSAGDIRVESNWNLGAASLDCTPCRGSSQLPDSTPGVKSGVTVPPLSLGGTVFTGYGIVREYAYRTRDGEAPVVTLRARGDLDINASVSDGFAQLATGRAETIQPQPLDEQCVGDACVDLSERVCSGPNGTGNCVTPYPPRSCSPGSCTFPPPSVDPIALRAPQAYSYAQARALYDTLAAHYPSLAAHIDPPPTFAAGDGALVAQYYGLYVQYLEYLLYGRLPSASWYDATTYPLAPMLDVFAQANETAPIVPTPPPADPRAYGQYLYQFHLSRGTCGNGCSSQSSFVVPQAPSAAYLQPVQPAAPAPDAAPDAGLPPGAAESLVPVTGAVPDQDDVVPDSLLTEIFTGAALGTVDNRVSPGSADLLDASLMGGMGSGCSGAACTSASLRLVAGSETSSASPLALDSSGQGDIRFHQTTWYTVTQSGPTVTVTVNPPNMIRTGAGTLELSAAGDFRVCGSGSNGCPQARRAAAIYTAGVAAASLRADTDVLRFPQFAPVISNFARAVPVTVTGTVHPVGAGDVRMHVQGDILGVAQPGVVQYWWQWMQTGNAVERALGALKLNSETKAGQLTLYSSILAIAGGNGLLAGMVEGTTETSINFGNFYQDLLSAGGDVSIEAGGDIQNFSASLPTTWYLNPEDPQGWTVVGGGGTLEVHAGGDIVGGSYFVSRGDGRIEAQGRIGAEPVVNGGVATLLALQDAQLEVAARQSVDIGGVFNPSYLLPRGIYSRPEPSAASDNILSFISRDGQPFSAQSAIGVTSLGGDVTFASLPYHDYRAVFLGTILAGAGSYVLMPANILPASLALTALAGDISVENGGQMFPSTAGTLDLIAGGSINFVNPEPTSRRFAAVTYPGQGRPNDYFWEATEPGTTYFGMVDAPPSVMPSPLLQHNAETAMIDASLTLGDRYIGDGPLLHSRNPMRAEGMEPARIYALGDITNGWCAVGGGCLSAGQPVEGSFSTRNSLALSLNLPVQIRAGNDIVNLVFEGQHTGAMDVSLIAAGRDIRHDLLSFSQSRPDKSITDSSPQELPELLAAGDWSLVPHLSVGGEGTLLVEAGRDVGPFVSQQMVADARSAGQDDVFRSLVYAPFGGGQQDVRLDMFLGEVPSTGINTIGNFHNPHLPASGADAVVLFGIRPGLAATQFAAAYTQGTSAAGTGMRSFLPDLIQFVRRYSLAGSDGLGKAFPAADGIDETNVWDRFLALSETTQRLFAYETFFEVLRITAADYNNPRSEHYHKYARGYEAINTLFPAGWGYTRNDLRGGRSGASDSNLVETGNLDLRGTTLQTQRGGDISVLGPGGQALIGGIAASPQVVDGQGRVFAGLSTQGVLTLEEGDINFFLDRSLLLGQSRVFTQEGGDILAWSSNGDINAGRSARSATEIPQPRYTCDDDHYCVEDRNGRVSGGGIATLQSVPGAPPGDVYLVAPRGIVDAGEGGIRVSGNLVVAAFAVANADNIQVQGTVVGVPSSKVDVGALSAGSAAAAAAQQQAAALARQAPPPGRAETLITVEVVGLGEGAGKRRKR